MIASLELSIVACTPARCQLGKGGGRVTKDEFLTQLEQLRREHAQVGKSTGCVECVECSACIDCVFCRDCRRCYRSRYSTGCSESSLLTHCSDCSESHSLAYCEKSDHCRDSNYLVACSYCFECDYCFGCVGLGKADFCILNRKYSRSDYFREVTALREALGL
jgi:hypothetical protein